MLLIASAKKAISDYGHLFDDIPIVESPEVTSYLGRTSEGIEMEIGQEVSDVAYLQMSQILKKLSDYLKKQKYSIAKSKTFEGYIISEEHYFTVINNALRVEIERQRLDARISVSVTLANDEGWPIYFNHD
jgi:hypothetical protein